MLQQATVGQLIGLALALGLMNTGLAFSPIGPTSLGMYLCGVLTGLGAGLLYAASIRAR